jgi:hypothetical protein
MDGSRDIKTTMSISMIFPLPVELMKSPKHLCLSMLEYQPSNPLSPLLPACRCNFNLGATTHLGHFVREICKAVALPILYDYLRHHHSLPEHTEHEVDWHFFQEAADNYAASDNHLMKLVYDQLPTWKQKSKSNEWVSLICKHCDQPESFDHLMRCHHSLSAQFRKKLPDAVLQYCNKQNAPRPFTDLLLQAIQDFLHHCPPLQMSDLPTVTIRIRRTNRIQELHPLPLYLKERMCSPPPRDIFSS